MAVAADIDELGHVGGWRDCGKKGSRAYVIFGAKARVLGRLSGPFPPCFFVTLAISSGLAYKLKPHVGNEGLMSSSVAGRMSEVSRSAPLITALFFIGPLVTAASPRTSPFFLMVIGLTLIVAALRRGVDWHALLRPNAALFALLILALYTCLSAAWAANPEGALSKSSLLAAATLVVFAGSAAITTLDAEEAQRASRALIAGALCGAGFLLIELLSDGALTRFAMNTIAAFRPDRAKHITIVGGRVTRINLSEFNQSAATLALLLWPGLLALRSAVETPRRAPARALVLPGTRGADRDLRARFLASRDRRVARGAPARAKWPRATIRGLAAMWCLGFVLVLPLDFLAYNGGLHQVKWLPSSFRARVIIWEYTAERVLEQPWIGIGADSTPAMKTKDGTPDWPKGFVYKRTTGQHAHNLFLQAWYELGVIGAILAALAGAAVALRLLALPVAAQAYGAASFTLFAVIAAFAWGMWQVWLMCAFALLPLYLGMAAQPFRARRATTTRRPAIPRLVDAELCLRLRALSGPGTHRPTSARAKFESIAKDFGAPGFQYCDAPILRDTSARRRSTRPPRDILRQCSAQRPPETKRSFGHVAGVETATGHQPQGVLA